VALLIISAIVAFLIAAVAAHFITLAIIPRRQNGDRSNYYTQLVLRLYGGAVPSRTNPRGGRQMPFNIIDPGLLIEARRMPDQYSAGSSLVRLFRLFQRSYRTC